VNKPCRQKVKVATETRRQDLRNILHLHERSQDKQNIFNSKYYNNYYNISILIFEPVPINDIKELLYPKLQGRRELIIDEKLLNSKYKDKIMSVFGEFNNVYMYTNDADTIFCIEGRCRGREALPKNAEVLIYVGHSTTLLKIFKAYMKIGYVGVFDVATLMSCDVAKWRADDIVALKSILKAGLYILPWTAKPQILDAVTAIECLIRQLP